LKTSELQSIPSKTSDHLKKKLNMLLPQCKEREISKIYDLNKIKQAIDRAKELDGSQKNRWPQSLGTHVYRLVEELLSFDKTRNSYLSPV
jgi:hypothetical protein